MIHDYRINIEYIYIYMKVNLNGFLLFLIKRIIFYRETDSI